MAVAAGGRLEAAGLECFDGCIFGFLTAHLKIGNLTIFADNQRVAEDGRIAKFLHQRSGKLVEGRSNRKYTDENAVIAAVTAAGYDPYEHKILGVTAMTALLGKKQFNDILGGLITKPQGKPTLVPDSDKRPAMTTIIDDFKEDN